MYPQGRTLFRAVRMYPYTKVIGLALPRWHYLNNDISILMPLPSHDALLFEKANIVRAD